ncbi:MAG: hypothetical protein ABEJ73_04695 [Haloplanus sp.]
MSGSNDERIELAGSVDSDDAVFELDATKGALTSGGNDRIGGSTLKGAVDDTLTHLDADSGPLH